MSFVVLLNERFWGCLKSHATIPLLNLIQSRGLLPRDLALQGRLAVTDQVRDFKDTVYPFFESDTLFLGCCFCMFFSCLAILRIEGCLNSTLEQYSWNPLTKDAGRVTGRLRGLSQPTVAGGKVVAPLRPRHQSLPDGT